MSALVSPLPFCTRCTLSHALVPAGAIVPSAASGRVAVTGYLVLDTMVPRSPPAAFQILLRQLSRMLAVRCRHPGIRQGLAAGGIITANAALGTYIGHHYECSTWSTSRLTLPCFCQCFSPTLECILNQPSHGSFGRARGSESQHDSPTFEPCIGKATDFHRDYLHRQSTAL